MTLPTQHRRRLSRVRSAVEDRPQVIRDAYAAGGTLREIAEAVGLSKSRVAEIVNEINEGETA